MLIVMSNSADDIIGNDSLEALPTWMSKLHEALDNHLDRFDSPELEIMPLIGESVSACGQHAAFQTHRQYFCLFACCAKTLSRLCCHSLNEVSRKPEEAILKLARLLLVVQPGLPGMESFKKGLGSRERDSVCSLHSYQTP